MQNELPKIILKLSNFINDKNQEEIEFKINQKYPYQEDRFKVIKPITGKVIIKKSKDQLWLNFEVKTKIATNCDRCLKPTDLKIKLDFERLAINAPKDESEIKINSENAINIMPAIWEEIILAIPSKILCQKNCKGICPICGTNLNQKSCSHCQKDHSDQKNPFSVLKKLNKN